MAETNVQSDQIHFGGTELQSIVGSSKNNRGTDVTVEGVGNTGYDGNCQDADGIDTKFHQATQTNLSALSIADIVVHEAMKEKQDKRM